MCQCSGRITLNINVLQMPRHVITDGCKQYNHFLFTD